MDTRNEILLAVQKIEEAFYENGVPFAKEMADENKNVIFYAANFNNKDRFGLVGWNEKENRIIFAAEYLELTERNAKEGFTEEQLMEMSKWIVLKNENEFINWFCGKKVELE